MDENVNTVHCVGVLTYWEIIVTPELLESLAVFFIFYLEAISFTVDRTILVV